MKSLLRYTAEGIAWTAIVGALFVLLTIFYWCFYPYPTTVILNAPVPIVNEGGKVVAGEALRLHMKWVKFTPVGADVTRLLLANSKKELVVIYSGSSAVPTGEHDRIISVPIPAWVLPGKYKVKTTYTYKVNPLREIDVSWESQSFEVVN